MSLGQGHHWLKVIKFHPGFEPESDSLSMGFWILADKLTWPASESSWFLDEGNHCGETYPKCMGTTLWAGDLG